MKYIKIANQFKLIEKERDQIGLSIDKLCQKVGITIMTYLNARKGKTNLGAETLFNICLVLELESINIKNL